MEITKREIMVSICIGALILALGFLLFGIIQDIFSDRAVDYDTALKIDADANLFNHAINTKIGNVLVKGNFHTDKGVSFPEIKGEFASITKTKEEYTMHTRIVTYPCGDSVCTRTEVYWSWDYAGEENRQVETINFLGNNYSYGLFNGYPKNGLELTKENTNTKNEVSWGYIYESDDVRYYYDIVLKSFDGVIFVNTINGILESYDGGQIGIYNNMTIQEVLDNEKASALFAKMMYWFIILSIGAIVIYQYLAGENRYLEDKNEI